MNRDRAIVIGVFAALLLLANRTGSLGSDFFSIETLMYLVALVPSIVLHEVSHGWVANKFGDPTAKLAGRLTLNPIRHIDPVGTVIVPMVLLLIGAPAFGWAKPVPVNVSQMSRNRQVMVSLVGPFTNILLSLVATLAIAASIKGFGSAGSWAIDLFVTFGVVNVALAVFNLIPVPPLDGSAIVERFIPKSKLSAYFRFRDKSIWVVMIVVVVLQMQFGIIGRLIVPFQEWWLDLTKLVVGGVA